MDHAFCLRREHRVGGLSLVVVPRPPKESVTVYSASLSFKERRISFAHDRDYPFGSPVCASHALHGSFGYLAIPLSTAAPPPLPSYGDPDAIIQLDFVIGLEFATPQLVGERFNPNLT